VDFKNPATSRGLPGFPGINTTERTRSSRTLQPNITMNLSRILLVIAALTTAVLPVAVALGQASDAFFGLCVFAWLAAAMASEYGSTPRSVQPRLRNVSAAAAEFAACCQRRRMQLSA